MGWVWLSCQLATCITDTTYALATEWWFWYQPVTSPFNTKHTYRCLCVCNVDAAGRSVVPNDGRDKLVLSESSAARCVVQNVRLDGGFAVSTSRLWISRLYVRRGLTVHQHQHHQFISSDLSIPIWFESDGLVQNFRISRTCRRTTNHAHCLAKKLQPLRRRNWDSFYVYDFMFT